LKHFFLIVLGALEPREHEIVVSIHYYSLLFQSFTVI
jgi:hypothetical protein